MILQLTTQLDQYISMTFIETVTVQISIYISDNNLYVIYI